MTITERRNLEARIDALNRQTDDFNRQIRRLNAEKFADRAIEQGRAARDERDTLVRAHESNAEAAEVRMEHRPADPRLAARNLISPVTDEAYAAPLLDAAHARGIRPATVAADKGYDNNRVAWTKRASVGAWSVSPAR